MRDFKYMPSLGRCGVDGEVTRRRWGGKASGWARSQGAMVGLTSRSCNVITPVVKHGYQTRIYHIICYFLFSFRQVNRIFALP